MANRGQIKKGEVRNPAGRPKAAEAASEIARSLVKKYALFDRLARIAAGEVVDQTEGQPSLPAAAAPGSSSPGPPTVTEQLAATKLLFAYAFGQPTQMVEGAGAANHDINITVTYVQQNRIEVTSPASGPAEGISGIGPLQLAEGGPAVREIDVRPSLADQRGTEA